MKRAEFSRKINSHISIFLGGWGVSLFGDDFDERTKKAAEEIKEGLEKYEFQSGVSYDITLAGHQPQLYSAEFLEGLGFKRILAGTNPNSGRRIESWFKSGS